MAKVYKTKKAEFDDMVYAYLMKRLRCPIEKSDSYFSGAIDDMGNPIANATNGSWAYTNLDKFIMQLKSLLGEKGIAALSADYDDLDAMYLMAGGKTDGYWKKFEPVIALVEETSYLPPEQRGRGEYVEEEADGMSKEQRLERALTIANFIMAAIRNNSELVSDDSYARYVLPSVESTFSVRSLGSRNEIVDYLKKGGLADYRQLLPEGHLLAVRLAKYFIKNDLCSKNTDDGDNYARLWRQLASYGG
jgi:hypothetical protein